jgi:hypothetical protein
VIEVAEVVAHEADEPDFVIDLLDSHLLTGEDGAQVDLLPVVADPAAAGDDGAAVVEGVLELGEA